MISNFNATILAFLGGFGDTTWLVISSVSVNMVDCFHAYGKTLLQSVSVFCAPQKCCLLKSKFSCFLRFFYIFILLFCKFFEINREHCTLHIEVLLQCSWQY